MTWLEVVHCHVVLNRESEGERTGDGLKKVRDVFTGSPDQILTRSAL